MSVNFNVRRIDEHLLAALRREPSLTEALCDQALRFDAQRDEAEFEAANPGRTVEALRSSPRMTRMLDAQHAALSTLADAGIVGEHIGATLHLERSWWGIESMILAPRGCQLVAADHGEPIGDDVGYGPALLLTASELAEMLIDLDSVTREVAEPRFRVHEGAEIARRRAEGTAYPATTDETFDRYSWHPFCALREFVRDTVADRACLLKWYD